MKIGFKFGWLKDFFTYLGSFPNIFSENSTKLLALLISALAGGFVMSIVIPFTLIWDVVTNGYIKTNLVDYGIFLVSLGAVMVGASYNVKVPGKLGKDMEDTMGNRVRERGRGDRGRRRAEEYEEEELVG